MRLNLMDRINPFCLTIEDFYGIEYPVSCYGDEHTVAYVKFALNSSYGLDPDSYSLYYNQHKLNEHKTLRDYHINQHSTVRLLMLVKTGR